VTALASDQPLPHGGPALDDGNAIHPLTSTFRHHLVLGAAAGALLLAACDTGPDDELQPPPVEDPTTEPAPEGDDATEPDDTDAAPDEGEDETDDPAATDDETADGAEPLDGEPTIGLHEQEGESGTLAVTDVRIATHEGFDRIVFETDGDGVPGWFVDYAEATAQGSGEEVEVEGDVTLRVAIRMVTLPPDLPEGLEVWDGDRLDGPPGGVVLELVEDTIFEGHHTFFLGLDDEQPFVVDRLDDPHRVVIDVHHER
jgi:hypothetical protein